MIGSPLLDRAGTARLGIVAGLLFLGALVLGWSAGDTPVPAPPAAPLLPWSLTAPKPDDPARDQAQLTARRPWSAAAFGVPGSASAARPAAAAPAAANWRLAGIVERGDDRFALIAGGAGTAAGLAYLRVGDRLPDGSVLTRIAADSATTADAKSPKQPRIYRLFGEKR